MAKFELRHLSDRRQADISRGALARNSVPARSNGSTSSRSPSMRRSRDVVRAMMNSAFRTVVAKR